MKLIEQIIEAFDQKSTPLHVDDIAAAIIKKFPHTQLTTDALKNKVASLLAAEVKKPAGKSVFAKIKGEKGAFRKGIYRLKISRKPAAKAFKVPEQPKVSNQFTGKAGEFAVMSELLFFGFNVSSMTVDDGIDLVASKGDAYFHIQVKTSNSSASNRFQFRITRKAFSSKDASGTFYVLVMRLAEDHKNTCEYLVLPSSEIRRLVEINAIRGEESMTITIDRERGGRYLLNGIQDVSWTLNRFDFVK